MSVVANFATVQEEGGHSVQREIDYYNLDAIISVGYRINSKRGVQFRQWATSILKDYFVQGYVLNQQCLHEKGMKDLQRTISLLSSTLKQQSLVTDIGLQAINIIHQYVKTWHLLLAYDENRLSPSSILSESSHCLEFEEALEAIANLKKALIEKGEVSALFGQQKGDHLQAILETLHQTFGGTLLYPSYQERAAHLLYFVIKDHPFVDGNKRIDSFLFLLYLQSKTSSVSYMEDVTLVTLALFIAESNPQDKELIIHLIMSMITKV